MYDELVRWLRNHSKWAKCDTRCPFFTSDKRGYRSCSEELAEKAADAIEELANKLCNWCGVCPKERRRPWDCEIMWPNALIPEVSIEPPESEEQNG